MFYIKLRGDMGLEVTSRETLYRGDHLNQKLTYLLPMQVGDIDIGTAAVYLSYIRADGTADIDLLNRQEDLYKESYYRFTMPITSKLTRYAGPVTTFLTIYAGPYNAPFIAKSGECTLHIQASTNMDDVVTDHNLSLVYSMQKQMEDKIAKRADGVTYDEETRELQLKSGEESVGEPVVVPGDSYPENEADAITDAVVDELNRKVVHFDGGTGEPNDVEDSNNSGCECGCDHSGDDFVLFDGGSSWGL